jgi:hypothetical protein
VMGLAHQFSDRALLERCTCCLHDRQSTASSMLEVK